MIQKECFRFYQHKDGFWCVKKVNEGRIFDLIEKKLRHDKLSRQFFVRNLSKLVVILVEILVAKAIPAQKPK